MSVPKVTFEYKINNIVEWEDKITPEFNVQGVPWSIEFTKENADGIDWLYAFLHCDNEEDSLNWSYAAAAIVRLIPFNKNVDTKELQIQPYFFDSNSKNFGDGLIKWNELLDVKNSFLHNNAINLQIEINVADPSDEYRSGLKCDVSQQCCAISGYASMRLCVTNIDALLAVRSPEFILRNEAWRLTVCKNQLGHLGIRLETTNNLEDVEYKTKMKVELICSKENIDPIKRKITKFINRSAIAEIDDLASWELLLESESGFVANKAITLDVKISVENPEGSVPNGTKRNCNEPSSSGAAKLLKLECPICLQTIRDQELSSLPCSHIFCTACITQAIKKSPLCPICKAAALLNDLRCARLPIAN